MATSPMLMSTNPPPVMARSNIRFQPNRSPIAPQIGVATAIVNPDAALMTPVHHATDVGSLTPSSWIYSGRNGNARPKPVRTNSCVAATT